MTTISVEWVKSARCRGLDVRLFYPDSGLRAASAQRVCAACPVRAACLEYALATGEHWGVWGGLTEAERRALRRERRREAAA